jgi:hypothetical protein
MKTKKSRGDWHWSFRGVFVDFFRHTWTKKNIRMVFLNSPYEVTATNELKKPSKANRKSSTGRWVGLGFRNLAHARGRLCILPLSVSIARRPPPVQRPRRLHTQRDLQHHYQTRRYPVQMWHPRRTFPTPTSHCWPRSGHLGRASYQPSLAQPPTNSPKTDEERCDVLRPDEHRQHRERIARSERWWWWW